MQRCIAAGSSEWSFVRLFFLTACLIGGGQAIAVGNEAPSLAIAASRRECEVIP